VKGREEILRVHARRIPLAPNVDLKVLARGTPGFSGADLANLVNEAALLAARQKRARRDARLRERQGQGPHGRRAALHDHQLHREQTIGLPRGRPRPGGDFLPGADPLHKVTIIRRGRALGLTLQLRWTEQVQQLARTT